MVFYAKYELIAGTENALAGLIQITSPSAVVLKQADVDYSIKTFDVDVTAEVIMAYGPVTDDGDGIVANWSNLSAINMTKWGIENYTEDQMLAIVQGMQAGTDTQSVEISEVKSYNLEDGMDEDYTSDTITLSPTQKLRRLPNGVCDTISDGLITRNVKEVLLNGKESWISYDALNNDSYKNITFYTTISDYAYRTSIISSNFKSDVLMSEDNEGFVRAGGVTTAALRINKTKLVSETVVGLKTWLSENPQITYYQTTTPTAETVDFGEVQTYGGATHITTDSNIPATITASIPTDVPALLSTKTDEIAALTTLTTAQETSVANLQTIADEQATTLADTQEAVENIIPLIL